MKIIVAKNAGFCIGVKRAVNLTLNALKKYKPPIYTYGPLIHNSEILKFLAKKGILTLNSIIKKKSGKIIIRAHGASPEIISKLHSYGFKIINATCPHVIRVQSIIKNNNKPGHTTVIVGNKNHPEVTGLIGCAKNNIYIINTLSEAKKLPRFKQAIIVAQTTQNLQLYKTIEKWTKKHFSYKVFNTICNSTEKRQVEVKQLANQVNIIVVIGGKQSSNTKRLVEIAQTFNKKVLHIESEVELRSFDLFFSTSKKIGIVAGASTPNWTINQVQKTINHFIFKKLNTQN